MEDKLIKLRVCKQCHSILVDPEVITSVSISIRTRESIAEDGLPIYREVDSDGLLSYIFDEQDKFGYYTRSINSIEDVHCPECSWDASQENLDSIEVPYSLYETWVEEDDEDSWNLEDCLKEHKDVLPDRTVLHITTLLLKE